MEKLKFEEIISKLGYQKNKWLFFHEIDSILLNSGKGFYPNWKYLKFLIDSNNKIYIRHGHVKPYGARLNGLISISGDYTMLTFSKTERGIPIESSSFYNEWFRQPKAGDIIRITENLTISHGESIIKDIIPSMNSVIIRIWSPINFPKNSKLSFYDPSVLNDIDNCIHSSIYEGIYMHFEPNETKKKNKFGIFHDEIKIKDIKEINLKIGKEYFNKTYKLE
jgi:hypothetical protein